MTRSFRAVALVSLGSPLLAACGAEPPPVVAAPAPSASAAPAPIVAESAPEPVEPAPPPVVPCSASMLALPFGTVVEAGGKAELDASFPSIVAEGFLVRTAVAIQIGKDETARALILVKKPEEDAAPSFGGEPTFLGIATCTKHLGYALAAAPLGLGDASSVVVWGVERVKPPGVPIATSLTLAQGGAALEFHAYAAIVGESSASLAVESPNGAVVGRLGVFGNVAEQFLVGGPGEAYARSDTAEGTGLYPLGKILSFLALRVENGVLRGRMLGALVPGPKTPSPSGTETWALIGKGKLPTGCPTDAITPPGVRCSRLAVRESLGTLGHTWIAGLWASPEEALAAESALGVRDADLLVMGASDERRPPVAPGHRRVLVTLKVVPPKPAKPTRRR